MQELSRSSSGSKLIVPEAFQIVPGKEFLTGRSKDSCVPGRNRKEIPLGIKWIEMGSGKMSKRYV